MADRRPSPKISDPNSDLGEYTPQSRSSGRHRIPLPSHGQHRAALRDTAHRHTDRCASRDRYTGNGTAYGFPILPDTAANVSRSAKANRMCERRGWPGVPHMVGRRRFRVAQTPNSTWSVDRSPSERPLTESPVSRVDAGMRSFGRARRGARRRARWRAVGGGAWSLCAPARKSGSGVGSGSSACRWPAVFARARVKLHDHGPPAIRRNQTHVRKPER